MKNLLKGINGRSEQAEKRISKFEDKAIKITQFGEPEKKRMKKYEQSIKEADQHIPIMEILL